MLLHMPAVKNQFYRQQQRFILGRRDSNRSVIPINIKRHDWQETTSLFSFYYYCTNIVVLWGLKQKKGGVDERINPVPVLILLCFAWKQDHKHVFILMSLRL